ncbi:hypothetical protein [Spirillospora albida]|uniref:hypothetical protein n=1 Tax=Spirillospora albida TaxID=58123 RepID=UPI0012FAE2F2|nr:hypothetical protein [Spirillospora albida]
MTKKGTESSYGELVRLAYFVLPGKGKRAYRLVLARRIVDGARGGPVRRRTRVLRRAMRPPRRLDLGLGPWLRALPPRLPDPGPIGPLARLEPPVRVAYVLRHLEGLPRYAVHDQLVRMRIRDPWPVIRAADAARVPLPVPMPFDPVLRNPVRPRPLAPVLAAAAATAVLAGALMVTEAGGPAARRPDAAGARPVVPHALRLAAAPPDAWTRGSRTLDAWPARGDLVHDTALIEGAARAWANAGGAGRGAGGGAQLLYAGTAGGERLVLMRRGDRLARYTGSLSVATAGTDASAPIPLGGGRYLLSPWDRKATSLAGAALPAGDGVVGPVSAGTRCGRGPLFRLGDRTIGDLGGPRAAVLTHRAPAARKAGRELGAEGLAAWRRTACALPAQSGPVTEAMAWTFWTGTLPQSGARADWVCARVEYPGGAVTRAALTGAKGTTVTGTCDDRRPVSGMWWEAPSGRWLYVAAAGRGFVPRARGPLRAPRVDDRLLVAGSPTPAKRPDRYVTLTAAVDREVRSADAYPHGAH